MFSIRDNVFSSKNAIIKDTMKKTNDMTENITGMTGMENVTSIRNASSMQDISSMQSEGFCCKKNHNI